MAEEAKTEQVKAHETTISMAKTADAEVDAHSNIELKVRVECSEKCNLQTGKVTIIDGQDSVVKKVDLTVFKSGVNETAEFIVKAPTEPGEYTWTAHFIEPQPSETKPKEGIKPVEPAEPMEGTEPPQKEPVHAAIPAAFSFRVKSHSTSMAVWDTPSPIVVNTPFKIKVGIRCVADCNFEGHPVAVYDHSGAQVATGKLGDTPWTETTALYWTEIKLTAPASEGFYTWEVKFPRPDLELAHEGTRTTFSFGTARPPDHTLTIEVVERKTNKSLDNAQVFLQSTGTPYRGSTDEAGVAKFNIPKGKYEVSIVKSNHQEFYSTVDVDADVAIHAEMAWRPDDD